MLSQNVPIITNMHKKSNNVRKNMNRHISTNETINNHFKDDALLLNELSNATAVETVAAYAIITDAAIIETSAPIEQSAYKLSFQSTDCDKSKVSKALNLFFAKLHETMLANIAKFKPTVTRLYTIEPVVL